MVFTLPVPCVSAKRRDSYPSDAMTAHALVSVQLTNRLERLVIPVSIGPIISHARVIRSSYVMYSAHTDTCTYILYRGFHHPQSTAVYLHSLSS